MKGPELIFASIGLTFILIAAFALLNGLIIERQGLECAGGDADRCERSLVTGRGVIAVTPWLSAIGVLFIGLGFGFALHRRWYGPTGDAADDGPGYP